MLKTTEKLINTGFSDRVFKKRDFDTIFGGSAARRFGLMNKAIASGEVIQLKRGYYILAHRFHKNIISKFQLAGQLVSGSYVSMESALSYHGWIPESVVSVSSIRHSGRAQLLSTPVGDFHYYSMPVNQYEFLSCVKREKLNDSYVLIAGSLRALADLVYVKKIEWQGLDYLEHDLRIEPESLDSIRTNEFKQVKRIYHTKRVLVFLSELQKEFGK